MMRSGITDVKAPARTVWGAFNAAGVITEVGSGDYTITKTGTGVYVIRFITPFRHVVAPICQSSTWNVLALVDFSAYFPDRVQVLGFSGATATDCGMSFSVSGRPL